MAVQLLETMSGANLAGNLAYTLSDPDLNATKLT